MATKKSINYGPSTGRYIDNDVCPIDWAKCGRPSQYRAHLRRRQEPCEVDRIAYNRDAADKRIARLAREEKK